MPLPDAREVARMVVALPQARLSEEGDSGMNIPLNADGEIDEGDGYEWCWIACPHDPPCVVAPPSSDPRDE